MADEKMGFDEIADKLKMMLLERIALKLKTKDLKPEEVQLRDSLTIEQLQSLSESLYCLVDIHLNL